MKPTMFRAFAAAGLVTGVALLAGCSSPTPMATTTTDETTTTQPASPAPPAPMLVPGTPGTVTTQTTHSQSAPQSGGY